MHRRSTRLVGAVVAALLVTGGLVRPGLAQQENPHRVVAIGDIHGAYRPLVEILGKAGLLDDQGRWAGGDATLVQTGDFTDRGAAIRPVIDLLMTLERQAEAAGGRVVILLGNHETMNLTRLLQDVSPEAIASFADERSEQRRSDAYKRFDRLIRSRRRDLGRDPPGVLTEEAWMKAHPPGFIEYLDAFGPKGVYGRWLREKQVIVNVDGTVLMHAGVNPQLTTSTLGGINARVRDEIARFDAHSQRLVDRGVVLPFFTFYEVLEAARADLDDWVKRQQTSSPLLSPGAEGQYANMLVDLLEIGKWSIVHADGPMWFRGFASWSAAEGAPLVARLQERYKAKRFVVGHTVSGQHEILPRFDNRVFLIDTGMLSEVYRGGRPSALEITGDRVEAIYLDRRVSIVDGPGLRVADEALAAGR